MTWLPPLLVAVPLLTAALVAGGDHFTPRVIQNAIGVAGSGATFLLALVLFHATARHDTIAWAGGWHPHAGIALGVDLDADRLGAGLCVLASGLVCAALVYSWTYMPEAAKLYDTLLLVCCGAMCGFALSGDVFNLFVWLELASVAAFALTGFEVRELGPLQGALNFSIVNTLGGYFVLIGVALLYARTGALNLAQIGTSLTGHVGDGLVIVAMTLIVCGFLAKAAIVPFHLWVADAYAVAPVPVCLVFAGVMTDIGLFGIARVYATMFSGVFAPHVRQVGDLLLWLGIVSALLGGVMALLQRHLKRMLAYSVVCHVGILLAGIALLSPKGLGGAAALLLADGLATGALFLVAGILLAWLGSIDELDLRRRAAERRWLGALWFGAALALAGPPYVGVYLGHSGIDDAAAALGRHWVQPLLWFANALAAGALFRAGARIFLGLGKSTAPMLSPEVRERAPKRGADVGLLAATTTLLTGLGLSVSLLPGIGQRLDDAARRFLDRSRYSAEVLHGVRAFPARHLPYALEHSSLETVLLATGSTLLAVGIAAAGVWEARSRRVRPLAAVEPAVVALKRLHSGVVGDYVAWLTVGVAVVGGVWALTLR
jgi:multicomponent Na+:H+ antiporter subunit D